VRSPSRYRLELARLLIFPLVEDRSPDRIAATRDIVGAMSLVPLADRWLRSHRWWRRVPALHAFGLLQFADRARQLVAALDDHNVEVRNAALDALADLRHPATLPAIVVRLHDTSLQRGRMSIQRIVSITPRRWPSVAPRGHERSCANGRRTDPREGVRAATFEALARTGLDDREAALAIAALDSRDVQEREMAAAALTGWRGDSHGPSQLARHLSDAWPVAVRAARALQSMGPAGRAALDAYTAHADQAGVLARQMLWEMEASV
jgi:HEAT repeat protein